MFVKQTEPRFGPDQVLPANSYTTTKPDGTVTLRLTERGRGSSKPISLHKLFTNIVKNYGDNLALSVKSNGIWRSWTYNEYFNEVNILAKSFIKLGLQRFHGVCIMGFNSPQWFISYYATVFSGGLAAGVYTSNNPEACRYLAENCKAQIIVVENKECVNKFLSIKRFLPNIKAIIQWGGVPEPNVLSWSEAMAIGNYENDDLLTERLSLQAVNQCCSVVYTSGTTGPPKGVMISQDHCTWAAKAFVEIFQLSYGIEVSCSYLPLSHIAGQVFEMLSPMACAAAVYFADSDALKGTLGQSLQEIQPTGIVGVPRVWEKIQEKILEVASKSGGLKRALGMWAKYHSLNYFNALENGRTLTTGEKIKNYAATKLIIDKIKNAIGFNRCVHFVTGAAPLSIEVVDFFKSIGIPLMDCYGMSECMGMGGVNVFFPGKYRIGTVGKTPESVSIKLMNVGKHAPGEGEICLKGRNICMGYLLMPEATKEAIDEDGWLHTGDLGSIDQDGFISVTGRLKELIITAGGENIPPVLIEIEVKKLLPFINNCMLIGDKRKYLTILLSLKANVNLSTSEPLQELTTACIKEIESIGCSAKTVAEARRDVESNPEGPLAYAILEGLKRYNKTAVSRAQTIQKWTILPHDFSVPTNELSSTLKLKRSVVLKKYSAEIDAMYEDKIISSKL